MLHILLVSARWEAVHTLAESLSGDPGVQLDVVGSGGDALRAIRTNPPHLVVIDLELPDWAPLPLVREMLMVNAMINTAVVSPLPDEEFHEASEGLGVLARLPLMPGPGDARELLTRLRQVLGLGAVAVEGTRPGTVQ